ncbi:MAG: glycosyltransferase family 39 protein [Planctomycetes bacterium]|nr:glycosyltransferase family 39 protein [Planctomycetota bacterium]
MTYRQKLFILLTALFIFRCVMACFTELLPEEAYYWTYAQNLSLSYYDHPNMVANIIYVFGLFGKSELTVRLGAIILSVLTSIVVFKLAKLLFNEETAFWSVIILIATPLSAASAFLMTPDAPLFFFWVLTIYCIARATRGNNEDGRMENEGERMIAGSHDPVTVSSLDGLRATENGSRHRLQIPDSGLKAPKTQRFKDSYWWYFAGLSMGAAWSSKYTASFLGISVLLYFLLSNKNRKWFLRKEPYIAILLAFIVFSPVIIWNYQNDWASFKFQTVHRAKTSPPFSIKLFLRFAGIQLGTVFPYWFPFVIYAAYKSVRRIITEWEDRLLLLMSFFLPMFLFFGASSFRQMIKLNWTSPTFFTAIIATAAVFSGKFKRTFTVFAAISLILTVFAHFLIAYPLFNLPAEKNFFGWNEIAGQIDKKIEAIAHENALPDSTPKLFILGCGNKYLMASEVNFYKKNPAPVVSVNAFGTSALEYDYITYPPKYIGWDALMVYDKGEPPANMDIKLTVFESADPPEEVQIIRYGKVIRTFVMMHCRNYKGPVFTDKEP